MLRKNPTKTFHIDIKEKVNYLSVSVLVVLSVIKNPPSPCPCSSPSSSPISPPGRVSCTSPSRSASRSTMRSSPSSASCRTSSVTAATRTIGIGGWPYRTIQYRTIPHHTVPYCAIPFCKYNQVWGPTNLYRLNTENSCRTSR